MGLFVNIKSTVSHLGKPPQKWRGIVRKILLLVVLSFVGLFVWGFAFPHESSTSKPVPLEDAKSCPIPLPSSARNVQFFDRFHFQEAVEAVRFEAPVQDCLDHVDVVIGDWRKTYDDLYESPGPVFAIVEQPTRVDFLERRFGVKWFDNYRIRKGVHTDGGGTLVPQIWVDTERGVFYYLMTD